LWGNGDSGCLEESAQPKSRARPAGLPSLKLDDLRLFCNKNYSSHHPIILGFLLARDRIYQFTLADVLADFFLSDRRCRSFSSKPNSLLISSSRALLSSLSVTTFKNSNQENN